MFLLGIMSGWETGRQKREEVKKERGRDREGGEREKREGRRGRRSILNVKHS